MTADFPNVAILGSGLLGGSLALALEQRGSRPRLWARRAETVDAALDTGISGATADLTEAVEGADLIVLAVPVGAMPDLVGKALACGLQAGCMITDVGSVKGMPHQTIPPLLAGSGVEFIGSHPMAGSERNGIDAASADLFHGAACLLTNDENVAADRAAALERFWQSIGCQTTWLTAAAHDALVARISHLPHIVAASAARVCLENPDDGRFGGGGLRDTTRVAAGNPDMWAEILTENRAALIDPLRATIDDLREILALLEKDDIAAVREWLATAKRRRDPLNPSRSA
jgi:prephenate dehydrogenase